LPEHDSDSRLRVVTLVDRPPPAGGGEAFAAAVTARLDPSAFERTLVISRWSDDGPGTEADAEAVARLRRAGVEVIGLGRRSRVELWSWRPLWRLLRHGAVDVLHSHKFGSNVWGSLLGGLAGTPAVVSHEHSWAYEGNAVRRVLDKQLVGRLSDRVIAVSREDHRRMIEIEGIPAEKALFVPSGIAAFETDPRDEARRRLGVAGEEPVAGLVGGLRPEKRIDLFLRAVAGGPKDLRAVVIGEGPERARLEALIGELGLRERVSLAGYHAHARELLSAFDVVLSCSDREGSPLSVMEYMEAGLPIAATAVGGVVDLIEDEREGLLVAPGDAAALQGALVRLLADPEAAAAMGRRARERRRREFDIGVTVERIEQLYGELARAAMKTPAAARSGSGSSR
jgi:glycosyltransferase involved in cell wall biosynthesis